MRKKPSLLRFLTNAAATSETAVQLVRAKLRERLKHEAIVFL